MTTPTTPSESPEWWLGVEPIDSPTFAHERPPWTVGEHCTMCGADAMHKVEEDREATLDSTPGLVGRYHIRHPFTAYVCCACFGRIMGPLAVAWCSPTATAVADTTDEQQHDQHDDEEE
jgi:hypothetical protein